ncbi:MAG: ATP-binding protein [Eubacterium sp.]|nr:ATP-binding protein [Eubacterium sp.]
MIKKVFKQMIWTQIISAMTVTLCLLIDNIMIGRFLGEDSIAAYGLTTPVLLIFAAFGAMISAGIQVVCSKTIGKGDQKGTDSCFTVSASLCVGVSALALIVVFLFPNQICTLLGAGDPVPGNTVFWLTKDYLIGFIVGAPAFICSQIMVPYVQIVGEQKRLITAVAMMTVADVTLDLVNVFAVKAGMFGMGMASSLSYYIALGIGLTYFLSKKCIFKFRIKLFAMKTVKHLIKEGFPTVVNQLSLVLLVYVLNRTLLNVSGNTGVAAYAVISTVANICYCFGSGIAAVALTLSSMFYVEEDKTSLLEVVKTMTKYAIVMNVIVIAVVFLTAPLLIRVFLTNPTSGVREMAVVGLRLFSLSLVSCAMCTTLKNYYQGTGRKGLTQLISVMQNFTFTALFAFVLSRFIGTTGIWLAFFAGETTTFLVILCIIFVKRKKVALSFEAMSLLEEDFGVPEENIYEAEFSSGDDIQKTAIELSDFCKAHGEDDKTSYYISLCMEEITTNIIKYGFGKDNKDHKIDIRYVIKKKKRTLRIRDDCQTFDPVSYFELHKDDAPTETIGIRVVMSITEYANYINSLGLNNLTLVF